MTPSDDRYDIAEGSAEHIPPHSPEAVRRRQEQIIRLMTRGVHLMNGLRKTTLATVIVVTVVGCAIVFQIDYMTDNRAKLNDLQKDIRQVDETSEDTADAYEKFTAANEVYIDNHARTQRLICGWYRANNLPLPDNGDCEGR